MPNLDQQLLAEITDQSTPVTQNEIAQLKLETPMWSLEQGKSGRRLERTFTFDQYADVMAFASRIAQVGQDNQMLPTMIVSPRSLTVMWQTERLHDIHRNDYIMAAKSDTSYLRWLDESRAGDVVNEASRESFPASDPPGWVGKTVENEGAGAEARENR